MNDGDPTPQPKLLHARVLPSVSEGPSSWTPFVGDETARFIDRWNPPSIEDRDNALVDAEYVISRAIGPEQPPAHRTVLAVGQVQSGKTLSFTLVTTLARDNHFGLVIVVAGTSRYLFSQSERRLRTDLDLDRREDARAWRSLANPSEKEAQVIADVMSDWREYPRERQTVLVTVMKNVTQLKKLSRFLAALDLRGIPALMIDDEADQASPNLQVAQNQESATYQALSAVRSALPHHSYLQYTATPQATLLVGLADTLSPDRVHVLRAGHAYTGGETFFNARPDLIVTIPDTDLPVRGVPLRDPPESLLSAFAIYVVGVGAAYAQAGGRPPKGNRSMMIHPTQEIIPHAEYRTKIERLKEDWCALLSQPGDPDYADLALRLSSAWKNLASTVSDLPALDAILPHLPRAIRAIRVQELNMKGPPVGSIDWAIDYAWVLVGGNALDRGFTVEGLTVTYMPRSRGVGNIDTLEQRARFFGYRRPYLGYCRVFLSTVTRDFYRDYVVHERELLKSLSRLGDRPLKAWTRVFVLDPAYKLTRQSVVAQTIYRENFAEAPWVHSSPLFDRPASESNDHLISVFLDSIPAAAWQESDGHPARTAVQRHDIVEVPLENVAGLLAALRVAEPADARKHLALLVQLGIWLDEHGDAAACVYRMSKGQIRRRQTDADDLNYNPAELRIANLFQGQNPKTGRGALIYPGDRAYFQPSTAVLQAHNVLLGTTRVWVLAMQLPADARHIAVGEP